MIAERFSIYLTGIDISNRDGAIEALAKLFKCSPATVANQLANPDVPIKKGLSSTVANQYMTAIERAGGRCDSRSESAVQAPLEVLPVAEPLSASQAGHVVDLPLDLPENAAALPELFPPSQPPTPEEQRALEALFSEGLFGDEPAAAPAVKPRRTMPKINIKVTSRTLWLGLLLLVVVIAIPGYLYFFPHGVGPHVLDRALKLDVSTSASFDEFKKDGGPAGDPYWRGYQVIAVQTSYNPAGRLDYFIVHFMAIKGSGYKFPSIENLESTLSHECGNDWVAADGSAHTKSGGISCGISLEKDDGVTAYVMNNNF